MAFTRPALQTIVDRIETDLESRLTGNVSLLRHALLRVLARVFAGAIHLVYGYIEYLGRQLFVDQAESEWLDRHASMWLTETRKAGSFSTGNATFSGSNGVLIPEETTIQNEDGIEFITLTDGVIALGTVTIPIQAVEDGTAGNLDGDTEMELVSPLSGVDSVALDSSGTTGGQNEETDAQLRVRILQRIQNPPSGGNAADYERWALEVSGVKNAWVFPLYDGDGTVGVLITALGDDPIPSTTLKDVVQDYIDARRPVTADFNVIGLEIAQRKLVDLTIEISPNSTDIQNEITTNLQQYFETNVAPGEDVLISGIRNAIFSAGVTDYDITAITVNGSSVSVDDIELSNTSTYGFYAYGVLDDLTYQDL